MPRIKTARNARSIGIASCQDHIKSALKKYNVDTSRFNDVHIQGVTTELTGLRTLHGNEVLRDAMKDYIGPFWSELKKSFSYEECATSSSATEGRKSSMVVDVPSSPVRPYTRSQVVKQEVEEDTVMSSALYSSTQACSQGGKTVLGPSYVCSASETEEVDQLEETEDVEDSESDVYMPSNKGASQDEDSDYPPASGKGKTKMRRRKSARLQRGSVSSVPKSKPITTVKPARVAPRAKKQTETRVASSTKAGNPDVVNPLPSSSQDIPRGDVWLDDVCVPSSITPKSPPPGTVGYAASITPPHSCHMCAMTFVPCFPAVGEDGALLMPGPMHRCRSCELGNRECWPVGDVQPITAGVHPLSAFCSIDSHAKTTRPAANEKEEMEEATLLIGSLLRRISVLEKLASRSIAQESIIWGLYRRIALFEETFWSRRGEAEVPPQLPMTCMSVETKDIDRLAQEVGDVTRPLVEIMTSWAPLGRSGSVDRDVPRPDDAAPLCDVIKEETPDDIVLDTSNGHGPAPFFPEQHQVLAGQLTTSVTQQVSMDVAEVTGGDESLGLPTALSRSPINSWPDFDVFEHCAPGYPSHIVDEAIAQAFYLHASSSAHTMDAQLYAPPASSEVTIGHFDSI